MSFKILDMLCMKFCNPSKPCGERSLARGRLNTLALCFLANAFALLKINNCHCGLDPQSQELSISSIAFPSSSTFGRRSSLSEAVKLQMRGVGSSRIQDFVMLNLFQHLTSFAYSLFINKILKQVQDDTIRNFRNELFNHSTLQLKNLACFVVLRTSRDDRKSLLNFSTSKLLNLKGCAGVNSTGLWGYLQAGKAGVKNA